MELSSENVPVLERDWIKVPFFVLGKWSKYTGTGRERLDEEAFILTDCRSGETRLGTGHRPSQTAGQLQLVESISNPLILLRNES